MLRLPEFQLLSPQSLSEALALLQADPEHSSILAGGTDLLPNMKRRQQTPRRLISLRNVAELGQLTVAADEVRIGGSIGIALFPQDGETPARLLERADRALYEAKASGRGAYRHFDSLAAT